MHYDKTTSTQYHDFKSMLNSADFVQFLNFPTNNKDHILDLVCCLGVMPFNLTSIEFPILDHKPVFFLSLFFKQMLSRSISLHQQYRSMTINDNHVMDGMIDHSVNQCWFNSSTSDWMHFYNDSFFQILDIVALMKTRTVLYVHSSLWYTPELRHQKAISRRLERLCNKLVLKCINRCILNIWFCARLHLIHLNHIFMQILLLLDEVIQGLCLVLLTIKILKPFATISFSPGQRASFSEFFRSMIDSIHYLILFLWLVII